MRRLALALLLLAPLAARAADPVTVDAGARTGLALTVYDAGDLAIVRDARRAALPGGDAELLFVDVPPRLDARTLALRPLDGASGLRVREQSLLWDLASQDQLLGRWVGREIELEETDDQLRTKVTPATLLAVEGGVVVRIGDRIVPNPPGRLRLPPLGTPVWTAPTLRWRVEAPAGAATLEASYATGGLAWSADYVVWLDAAQTRADLTAWITLVNGTPTAFPRAALALVAGQVNRVQTPERPFFGMQAKAMAAPPAAEMAPGTTETEFTEYHRYAVEGAVDVAPHETKQVPLLSARGVGVTKRYVAVGASSWLRAPVRDPGQDVPVHVVYALANTAKNGLGRPLPAGIVRFYAADADGAPAFVGEDRLRHLAVDETAELEAGDAFDVVARRTQTEFKKLDVQPFTIETAWEIRLRNRRREAVTVDVREPVEGEWKVVASSLPPSPRDARTLGFDVPVPAGGETTLTYRVQVGR